MNEIFGERWCRLNKEQRTNDLDHPKKCKNNRFFKIFFWTIDLIEQTFNLKDDFFKQTILLKLIDNNFENIFLWTIEKKTNKMVVRGWWTKEMKKSERGPL